MRALVVLSLIAGLAAAQTPEPLLKWMDSIAERQLSSREAEISAIRNVGDARERQRRVRSKILELIGGLPDYTGPLNARVTGTIPMQGYNIDKVIFESLPGYLVTGNVYIPNSPGRHPGVLFALGHWDEGKPAAQLIAANLALKGFVVLTYDPVGQGERQQAWSPVQNGSLIGGSTEQHTTLGAQSLWIGQSFARYRIWDAKRALDYLASRPEVDPDKLGASGCSGGGTVATYISALDPRVKVAAPSCYVNSFHEVFPGPTGDAEQSVPNFIASGFDIADYIELFAPKPWLVGSTEGDFFPIAGARRAVDEAKRYYSFFDAQDRVKWVVGPGGHGTPKEVREGIYGWMIRWLKDGKGSQNEETVELLPDWRLWASQSGQVGGRQLFECLRDERQRMRKPLDRTALATELKRIATGPESPALPFTAASEFKFTGIADQILIRSGNKIVSAHPAVPKPLTGNWISVLRALMIGENMAGLRIRAIGSQIDQLGPGEIEIAARGMPAVWAAAAAAIDPRITRLSLDRMPVSVASAFETPLLRNPLDALLIPGFALHWDFNDLLDNRASRSDPVDWTGTVLQAIAGAKYHVFGDLDRILF